MVKNFVKNQNFKKKTKKKRKIPQSIYISFKVIAILLQH